MRAFDKEKAVCTCTYCACIINDVIEEPCIDVEVDVSIGTLRLQLTLAITMSHLSSSPFQRARPCRVLEDRLFRGRGGRGRTQHLPPGGQADMQAMCDNV